MLPAALNQCTLALEPANERPSPEASLAHHTDPPFPDEATRRADDFARMAFGSLGVVLGW